MGLIPCENGQHTLEGAVPHKTEPYNIRAVHCPVCKPRYCLVYYCKTGLINQRLRYYDVWAIVYSGCLLLLMLKGEVRIDL